MGRPPLGKRAMSDAERQRQRRKRLRDATPQFRDIRLVTKYRARYIVT